MENFIQEKTTRQLLIWEFSGLHLGADIENCLETKAEVEIFPVPYSKKHIAGIANLRGEISLVYDLTTLLGQEPRKGKSKEMIVRLKFAEKTFSLIVDSITEVLQESSENFKPASSYLKKEDCEYISSILNTEIGLVQILNLEKIYNA